MSSRFFPSTILALTALIPAVGYGEFDRTQKPEPGPAPAISFPDFEEVTLPNGLRIYLIQDDRRPTVTFRLMIKSGSVADAEKPGTASFTATLLNRGTAQRDAAAFARETDFLGSHVEALAGTDAISLTASSLNKYTAQLLDLMADAARNPVFAEEQLTKIRKQTLSALEAQKQEPAKLAAKLIGKLVFGDHPYGTFQTPESVQSITREDLTKFHATHFRPNNATLAVVGDVTLKDVLPLIEKAFGSWERGEIPALPKPHFPSIQGRSIHLIDRPGSVQSNIIVGKTGPSRGTPDLPEIIVLNATLGGSASGRLYGNLREKHGWTYGSYSFFDMRRDGGAFQATAETRNDVTAPAIKEILKEIGRIRDEPVPEAELGLQREYNVGNYLLSLENSSRTAQRVQDIDLYGLPTDFYRSYARRMGTASPELILKTAKAHLDADNSIIVVVGEAKDIKTTLEAIGPVRVYGTDLKPQP
ncbi:MAG: pitrilysin family protein [Verrucomicrobiota bacterium]